MKCSWEWLLGWAFLIINVTVTSVSRFHYLLPFLLATYCTALNVTNVHNESFALLKNNFTQKSDNFKLKKKLISLTKFYSTLSDSFIAILFWKHKCEYVFLWTHFPSLQSILLTAGCHLCHCYIWFYLLS